jgi:hypothetical protein
MVKWLFAGASMILVVIGLVKLLLTLFGRRAALRA